MFEGALKLLRAISVDILIEIKILLFQVEKNVSSYDIVQKSTKNRPHLNNSKTARRNPYFVNGEQPSFKTL